MDLERGWRSERKHGEGGREMNVSVRTFHVREMEYSNLWAA